MCVVCVMTFHYLQDLLTRHKILCAQFLEQNYDKVFRVEKGCGSL